MVGERDSEAETSVAGGPARPARLAALLAGFGIGRLHQVADGLAYLDGRGRCLPLLSLRHSVVAVWKRAGLVQRVIDRRIVTCVLGERASASGGMPLDLPSSSRPATPPRLTQCPRRQSSNP